MKKVLKELLNPSLLIFILALVIRSGYLIWVFKFSDQFQSRPYIPTSDRRFYDSIAVSFLNGYGLNWYNIFSAHYPPFYPIFLAFIYSIFGHNYIAVFFIQTILSSLAPVFVFWIGKKIFNLFVGFIAALIIVFYLPFITVIQDLELENLLIFMPLLFITILLTIERKTTWRKKVIVGIIMGLTILTKPVFLFLLPAFCFLWLKITSLKKYFWRTIFIIYFSCILVLSLWLFRNFLIYKKIFFSSQTGTGIWSAINPQYENSFRLKTREILWNQPNLNEVEINNFYAREGIRYLKTHPIFYLKQVVGNWYFLFRQNTSLDLSVSIIILALVGLVLSFIKKNKKSWVFFLLFLLFCGQYSILWTNPRFRMPLDWIIIFFSAYAIYSVLTSLGALIFGTKRNIFRDNFLDKFIIKQSQPLPSIFRNFLLIAGTILTAQFLAKIGFIYLFPKTLPQPIIHDYLVQESLQEHNLLSPWNSQESKKITYKQVYDYQKQHHGEIGPFLGQIAVWKGEISYLNRNAVYPFGSAKHPEENQDPEYKGFYDIYFLPSTTYSTFDLIVNRGEKPGYYGDGIVIVNQKGSLDFSFNNGDQIVVIGKIIGQNFLGQIYLEGYGVFK